MSNSSVRVFAPATVANVSCGYDTFGLALEAPGDEVEAVRSDKPGVRLLDITGDGGILPRDAALNTVSISIIKFLEHQKKSDQVGIDLILHKKMPLGSGLGSSAASAVAGVYAANELLGRPLHPKELLPFAMEGERAACGSAHADNVAPCLLGGFVLIRSYRPLDIISLSFPEDLAVAVVHPEIEVKTKDARFMLKKQIELSKAVTQFGNIGGMVAGLLTNNYEWIGKSMEDVLIEPTRSLLIPGYAELKERIIEAGALGSGISGSGPSVFAFCQGLDSAKETARVMKEFFSKMDVDNQIYTGLINREGPVSR